MNKKYCMSCGSANDFNAMECVKCKKSFASIPITPRKSSARVKVETSISIYEELEEPMKLGDITISKSSVKEKLSRLEPISEEELPTEGNKSVNLREIIKKDDNV